MPSSDKPIKPRPAYVETADSDGERVRGTRKSAKKSDKDRSSRSSKKEKQRSDSGYSSHAANINSTASSPSLSRAELLSDDTAKAERLARRNSTTTVPAKSSRKTTPPSAHHNGESREPRSVKFPALDIPMRPKVDPSHFGVPPGPPPMVVPPPRTASARPLSYHDRPPLARSAFYVAPVTPIVPLQSFPPASPGYMQYAAPTFSQPYTDSYFNNQPQARPLAERFRSNTDPIQRPASTTGIQRLAQNHYAMNGYTDTQPKTIRRMSRDLEDYHRMPPPPRPEPRRPDYHRGMTTPEVREGYSPHYADETDDDERWSRRASRSIYPEDAPRRRSSTSRSRGNVYEDQGTGYYDGAQRPLSVAYEDKYEGATRYQNHMQGGPTENLTAEALRRVQRPSVGSRSTRSSGSKDESDFRQKSATTRTTTSRIATDDDDITIRIVGAATMKVGDAEIKYNDGAEVYVGRRKSLRNGSERSSEYGGVNDDRHSRINRPANLSRSTSKSGYSNPWDETQNSRARGNFF